MVTLFISWLELWLFRKNRIIDITLGGVGIWAFIRLFTLNRAIKPHNKDICIKSGLSANEMMRLGVL